MCDTVLSFRRCRHPHMGLQLWHRAMAGCWLLLAAARAGEVYTFKPGYITEGGTIERRSGLTLNEAEAHCNRLKCGARLPPESQRGGCHTPTTNA